MSNTYTWIIESLDCIPSADGQNNVVSNVHWRVNAISTQTQTIKYMDGTTLTVPYNSTVYGVQPLTYTAGSPFTAYADITKDIVIGWVQAAMGAEQIAAIQSNLDNQISNLANPPVITLPLPWLT